MLAICSDLDETPDARVYEQIARYLNTTASIGRMGPGVGLEVGNTIYFAMPRDQFAWYTTDDAGRAMIAALCRSGHIDCLHSYGDLVTTRAQVERALDELGRAGAKLEVWIDHSVAPSNFGSDIMRGQGDAPGAEVYHADLTWEYGVRYIWRGRVTSIIGQERPRSLRGLFTLRHPVASAKTAAKELAKGVLAARGNGKYAMHGPNRVLRPARLRDGRPVYEFLRSNAHWRGVEHGDTAAGLAEALSPPVIDRLISRGGVCVHYTHLGKVLDPQEPFPPATRAALQYVAAQQRAGRLLVTTTRRLLGYLRAAAESQPVLHREGNQRWIELTTHTPTAAEMGPLSSEDLAGMTFYVADPARTRIRVDGREVATVEQHRPDESGRASVSIPWRRLAFPTW
jgi:hypothetical protein